jgi:hypothetical protein
VRLTLIQIVIPEAPKNLIGDNAATAKTRPRTWDASDVMVGVETIERLFAGVRTIRRELSRDAPSCLLMILLRYL